MKYLLALLLLAVLSIAWIAYELHHAPLLRDDAEDWLHEWHDHDT